MPTDPDIRDNPPGWLIVQAIAYSFWVIGAWVAFFVFLSGCATTQTRLVDPLEFPPVVRYELGDIRSVVGEPVLLVAGDVAPADGYLLTVEQWAAVRDEVERMSAALSECYSQQEADRRLASLRVEVVASALSWCRKEHHRTFWSGFATGSGACGAAVGVGAIIRQ